MKQFIGSRKQASDLVGGHLFFYQNDIHMFTNNIYNIK